MPVNITIEDVYTPISIDGFDKAIVIVDHATSGPSMTPVYLTREIRVDTIFGADSNLTKSCRDAFMCGAERIIAMRINGMHAHATLNDTNGDPALRIKSLHATSRSNNINIIVSIFDDKKVFKVYGADGELQVEYMLDPSDTVSQLCGKINHDVVIGKVEVIAEVLNNIPLSLLSNTDPRGIWLDEGFTEDIIHPSVIFERMQTIYDMLESVDFDIIAPMCFAYIDSVSNVEEEIPISFFYNQLSSFCERRAVMNMPVMAVIKSKPNLPSQLETLQNEFLTNRDNLDFSKYIVVVGVDIFAGSERQLMSINNVACAAALINSIAPNLSPVNKAMNSSLWISTNPTDAQISTMANMGICAFRESIRRGVTMASEVTSTCDPESQFNSIRNVRLCTYLAKRCKYLFDSHIGEILPTPHNVLNQKLDALFKEMQDSQYISDYQYTVSFEGTHRAYLSIEVVPYGQVKTVFAAVRLYI